VNKDEVREEVCGNGEGRQREDDITKVELFNKIGVNVNIFCDAETKHKNYFFCHLSNFRFQCIYYTNGVFLTFADHNTLYNIAYLVIGNVHCTRSYTLLLLDSEVY